MRHLFAVIPLLCLASAERFTVIVGQEGTLTYEPPSVTARRGDIVAFQFVSKNHTVTQSSFAKPCEPLASPAPGIDSGYLPVAAGATSFPEWSFTVEDDSSPLWFFCAQGRHCQSGMVFAMNPTPERTFEAFKATAMGAPPPSGSTGTSTGAGGTTTSSGSGPAVSSPAVDSAQGGLNNGQNGALLINRNSATMFAALGLIIGFLL